MRPAITLQRFNAQRGHQSLANRTGAVAPGRFA